MEAWRANAEPRTATHRIPPPQQIKDNRDHFTQLQYRPATGRAERALAVSPVTTRPPVTHAALAAAGSRPILRLCALAYAALGIPVLPLHHPVGPEFACSCGNPDHTRGGREEKWIGKHPRTVHGFTEATTDPDIIRDWWWKWPAANIGLRTGFQFDVIDVDDADGFATLTGLLAAGRTPEPLATATTGRPGGVHWLIPVTGAGNSTGGDALPGIDFRGLGGYIVAAPSQHRTGNTYRWTVAGAVPVEDANGGLAVTAALPWLQSPLPAGVDGRQRAYALKVLAGKCDVIAGKQPKSRNNAVWAAGIRMGTMTGPRWVDRDVVERAILVAAASSGTDEARAIETLRRALNIGEGKPPPVLTDRPGQAYATVDDVVGSVLAWAASPDASQAIGSKAVVKVRLVIEYACQVASLRRSREVSLPVREIETATGLPRSAAARFLKRLSDAQVLTLVTAGGYASMTGSVYELSDRFVAKWDRSSSAERAGTFGALSQFATTSPRTPVHDVWGSRRGVGHGLTPTDRALLRHLPGDGTISKLDWAIKALAGPGSRQTAHRASDPSIAGSLASYGLVRRAGRGLVEITDKGREVLLAGEAGLDGLAAELEVTGRSEVRAVRISDERAAHHLERLPAVVDDALRGRPGGTTRARGVVKGAFTPGAYEAMDGLLLGLDDTADPKVLRPAAARVVAVAGLTEQDAAPRVARARNDTLSAVRATDRAAALRAAAESEDERAAADRAVEAAKKRTLRANARASELLLGVAEQDRVAFLRWDGVDTDLTPAQRLVAGSRTPVGGHVWNAAAVAVAVAGREQGVPVDFATGEVLTGDLADRRAAVVAATAHVTAIFAIDPLPAMRDLMPLARELALPTWPTEPLPGYRFVNDRPSLLDKAPTPTLFGAEKGHSVA